MILPIRIINHESGAKERSIYLFGFCVFYYSRMNKYAWWFRIFKHFGVSYHWHTDGTIEIKLLGKAIL